MAETAGEMNEYEPERERFERRTQTGDPARLEAEIEETRREMGETIDEIQERLDPDRLKRQAETRLERAVDRAKDEVYDATVGEANRIKRRTKRKVNNWRSNMVDTVKENPVPAALLGIGLGWLVVESSNREQTGRRYRQYETGYGPRYDYDYDYDYGYDRDFRYEAGRQRTEWDEERSRAEQARERYLRERGWADRTAEELEQRASRMLDEARTRAESLGDDMQTEAQELTEKARREAQELRDEARRLRDEVESRARQLQSQARREVREAKRGMQQLMEENPLALGAAALALGAVVGWMAPGTEMEDELMGDQRDQLLSRAQRTAEQAMDKVQDVAKEAESAARTAAKDVAEETKKAAREVTRETKEEAQRVAGQAESAAAARSESASRATSSRTAREAQAAARNVAEEAKQAAREVGDEARDAAKEVADETKKAAKNVKDEANS